MEEDGLVPKELRDMWDHLQGMLMSGGGRARCLRGPGGVKADEEAAV